MTTAVCYYTISTEEGGQRLDNYLIRILKGVPKSHIYRIIRGGEVRVNKKRAQPSLKLAPDDSIRVPPIRTSAPNSAVVGDKVIQLLSKAIIFEDNHLLVLNKPAGIAVHGGSGLSLGVIEALRQMRDDLPYLELAHRLDKDTSGCLVLAKKRSALRSIQAALEAREVTKTYWAIVEHRWADKKIVQVDAPLLKNTLQSGERMVVVDEHLGKPSLTQFKLLENYTHACWIEAQPKTGRTHQIRVHSTYIHHPIIGDPKYGEKTAEALEIESIIGNASRLYLHARAIQFTLNGEKRTFQADLDHRFSDSLTLLRQHSTGVTGA